MAYQTAQKKPQLNFPQYGLVELELFPRLTRATFKSTFNEQAPAWDKTRRIQRWFDSEAGKRDPEDLYIYKVVTTGNDGQPVWRNCVVTCREAATPNLPGHFDYPKYMVQATKAYVTSGQGDANLVSAEQMCLIEEAQALAVALSPVLGGAVSVEENKMVGVFTLVYPADEPRRIYNLVFPSGDKCNAQQLLLSRYSAGVGSPGHWNVLGLGVQWISDIPSDTGEYDARPEVLIPMRDLFPNEKLAPSMGAPVVQRTDFAETQTLDDTKAMPKRVAEIHTMVKALIARE